ncbi:lysine--tRNA ligase [Oceanisphaera pacifica]|uniref:Lysine--tRNA ligase n=1 Tax=Oceanisphaera pacifica TaxID=2818389 RepID=A0ABS3ND09_9GAMM|nr:lysine--tRNA ligase [Oceanisphaera pacifica]MBO1518176.1 lysine--tRNA ligase [Oceanisphaera pacifica]
MTEQVQDENKLIAERRAKLDHIRKDCPANGHPNNFQREHLSADLQAEFGERDKEALVELNKTVSVAGRIMAKRGPFLALQDMSGRIQAYATKDAQKIIKEQYTGLDIGDIVGVTGVLNKSGKGDLYVSMDKFQLLTKALRPLPEKFHGLSDQETRYRQRYLDLITNESSRHTFQVRSQVVAAIRQFMNVNGFMEVETPMMQVIPGGATARPFITHHNALDMDMYLRIAPELYLKRLVVGGFEKVFEINRNFRNEGLSPRHNPEFTMMEFYWAYANYQDLMDFTENMLRTVTTQVLGNSVVQYGEESFDFGQPFARLSMKDSILEFNPEVTAEQLATLEAATAVAEGLKINVEKSWGLGRVITEIFEETVEHRLIQPTFITEYPAEVSPLARRDDKDPSITERFEFFIGGREIANGFAELNDAEDQEQRFKEQVDQKEAGDDEAMFFDEDYITALEHGLPPTAGQGIGIDRLVMLLTDSHTIRDVILFPTLRPSAK